MLDPAISAGLTSLAPLCPIDKILRAIGITPTSVRTSRLKILVENSCTLAIKVIPNAPRSEFVGWLGDALKVKVHAPPVEGRANEALCAYLAGALRLPRRNVAVLRGDTSRQKIVRIVGLTLEEAKIRLFPKPQVLSTNS